MPKIIIGAIILLILLAIFVDNPLTKEAREVKLTSTDTSTTSSSPSNATSATLEVVQALSNYYLATTTELDDNNDIFTEMMTSLLNQNKYLETGNIYIKKYLNDNDKYIQLAAFGMTTGAGQVIQANNSMIDFLRNVDLDKPNFQQELSFTIASYKSDQKEGFKNIFIAAPQVTGTLFEPAKSDNPTGNIPYTISKEERLQILNQIDRLFGDELKKYPKGYNKDTNDYNSVLSAIEAIKNNVLPDTYEEAKNLEI